MPSNKCLVHAGKHDKQSITCPTTIQHQRWLFAAAPKLATLAFHLSVQPTVNSALVFWIIHYLNEGVPVALLPKTLLQHLITQRKETKARAAVFANLWLEIAVFIPQSIRKQSILSCNDLVPGGYDRGGVGWSCSCKQFVDRVEAKLWEYAGTHDVGHILASYTAFLGALTYEPETDALLYSAVNHMLNQHLLISKGSWRCEACRIEVKGFLNMISQSTPGYGQNQEKTTLDLEEVGVMEVMAESKTFAKRFQLAKKIESGNHVRFVVWKRGFSARFYKLRPTTEENDYHLY